MTFRPLFSYHYYRVDLEPLFLKLFGEPPWPPCFADSGAFSALTQGAAIDRDAYAGWLTRHRHLFDAYANLDRMHDPEGTWENQQRLEDAGLAPLPAFHVGEDIRWLAHYFEHGYRYIALGGMVGRSAKAIFPWCVRAHQMARDAGAVLHGFGLTAWKLLSALPWYSADSSSWGKAYRFGIVALFDVNAGRWVQFMLGSTDAHRHRRLCEWYGYTPEPFVDRTVTRAQLCKLGALTWSAAEVYLRRRHGAIKRPGSDATGMRVYLADGSDVNMRDGAAGFRLYLAGVDNKSLQATAEGLDDFNPGGGLVAYLGSDVLA